jgi:hypothetical protein
MPAVPSGHSGIPSYYFPAHLSSDFLYPETTAAYTDADGTSYDVSCFAPRTAEVQKVHCPPPFVNPLAVDDVQSCIQPCPIPAYTDEEYTFMWGFGNGIGLCGLLLNLYMALTWTIADKRDLMKTPYQLKFCVFAGLLFGAVGTLPSSILKYHLPCTCETEEWYFLSLSFSLTIFLARARQKNGTFLFGLSSLFTLSMFCRPTELQLESVLTWCNPCLLPSFSCSTGSSAICSINRTSIYVLLGILINLSALTFELVFTIFKGDKRLNKKLLNATSTVVPFVLAAVGFALEGEVEASLLPSVHCMFSFV